jgi:hypothetical protein
MSGGFVATRLRAYVSLRHQPSRALSSLLTMDLDSDSDLWASMSLPMAFGKAKPKKGPSDALSRFDKTKRVEEVNRERILVI